MKNTIGKKLDVITYTVVILIIFTLFPNILTTPYQDNILHTNMSTLDSSWPCYGGDTQHTSRSHFTDENIKEELKWTSKIDKDVYSSPVIDKEGNIYIGSENKYIYSIFNNGTLDWKYSTAVSIYSSPVLDSNNNVYVGTMREYVGEETSHGQFFSLNKDGELRWFKNTDGGLIASPVIGEHIYIADALGKIYALNYNGREIWNFSAGDTVWSSPSIGPNGNIYFGSWEGKLYCLNQHGEELWNYSTGDKIYSSPSVDDKGIAYVGSDDKKVYAVNDDGTLKWSIETKDLVKSSPSIGANGDIYIGSNDDTLYAVKQNGQINWTYKTNGDITASPSIGNGNIIYFGNQEGKFFALYPDGMLKWEYETSSEIYSSAAIDVNGNIYFSSLDGTLYCFGKKDKTFEDDLYITILYYAIPIIAIAATSIIYYKFKLKKKK